MKPITLKCSELVFDFDLYPRPNIDAAHVRNIMTALEAGEELPPIVVDEKSKRIVDGFHRVRAMQRHDKDNATIQAILHSYASDKALFLEAVRLNAAHGRSLTSYDRAHAIILADKLGIDHDVLAGALRMTLARVNDLRIERSAIAEKLTVPLKRTIRHMAGRKLSKGQQEANVKLSGMDAGFYVRQVILLLENDLLDPEDEELDPLLDCLAKLLRERKKALAV